MMKPTKVPAIQPMNAPTTSPTNASTDTPTVPPTETPQRIFQSPKHLEQLNPIGRYNIVSTPSLPSKSNTSLSRVDSPPENTMIPHPAVGFSTELKAYHAAIMLCIYLTASVATNPVETYAALSASAHAILKPVRATIRILLWRHHQPLLTSRRSVISTLIGSHVATTVLIG